MPRFAYVSIYTRYMCDMKFVSETNRRHDFRSPRPMNYVKWTTNNNNEEYYVETRERNRNGKPYKNSENREEEEVEEEERKKKAARSKKSGEKCKYRKCKMWNDFKANAASSGKKEAAKCQKLQPKEVLKNCPAPLLPLPPLHHPLLPSLSLMLKSKFNENKLDTYRKNRVRRMYL